MTAGLRIKGLSVSYGRRKIVEGLDLPPLEPGEIVVLAGPNAAGKSTLLKGIAGLLPARGEVTFRDGDLLALSAPRRAQVLGFMPQTLPAGAALSVLESVIAARSAGGEGANGADRAAIEVLERLGIGTLALEPLDRLSGGQRQMVGLAQALVRDPALLMLDEPTSALDMARQVRLLTEVRRVASEGRVVIAVLHDLALAAQWADRIAVLHKGRLHSFGTPAEVVTPAMLAQVYGVAARVERCSRGRLMVLIDGETA